MNSSSRQQLGRRRPHLVRPGSISARSSYLLAMVIILVTLGLSILLRFVLPTAVLVLIYPAAFLVAWICGFWPSVLGTVFFIAGMLSLDRVLNSPLIDLSKDEPGRLVLFGFLSTATSWVISRERRADALQARSEERLRSIFNNAGVGIIEVQGPEDRIVAVNERILEMLGYAREELLGMSVHELTAPEDREVSKTVNSRLRSGRTRRAAYEKRYLRRDGRRVWVQVNTTAIRNEDGSHRSTIGTIEDISARKEAETALRESEERFRALADIIPQLVWETSAKGNPIYYNSRWYEYTGMPDIGDGPGAWRWREILHPDDFDRTVARWGQSLESGEPYQIEYRLRERSGAYRWQLARAVAVRDEAGRITRWFGTCTDIHERKQAEADLTEALKVRDDFLSIASHELRTPMTSLKLQAQSLKRSIERNDPAAYQPERVQSLATHFDRQIKRLVRLVDDMLDVSRIQAGKLELHLEEFELCRLVEDTVERIRPQLIEGGTPPEIRCSDRVEGRWDRYRIEQVMTNLLTNAMKYGDKRPITVTVARRGDFARIEVRDRGRGIAKEDQRRVFKRFERAVSTNEVSGLGIGLYISERIVRTHRGRIWVESEPGHGSNFIVELPIGIGLARKSA